MSFFIDPQIVRRQGRARRSTHITLSYTFYPVASPQPGLAEKPPAARLRHRQQCRATGRQDRTVDIDFRAARRRDQGAGRMADTHAKHHDYHLVNPSPWPAVGATGAFVTAVGLIIWMRSMGGAAACSASRARRCSAVGVLGLLFTMVMWWRDVIKEAHGGDHTPVVQLHLRYGMILFIASEVMFFVAWFWAYFDAALFPAAVYPIDITTPNGTVEAGKEIYGMVERNTLTGGHWPPKPSDAFHGTFDPWGLPLVNTLILLTSGTTVTWAHHALLENDRRGLKWGLLLTIMLGVLFTACQAYEYAHAGFKYRRPHLRLDLLHGHRLPRRARHHRHDVPDRVPVPRAGRPFHAQAALRLRGGRLVLALRRRRLAVPVHVHLRVGRRHAGPALRVASAL